MSANLSNCFALPTLFCLFFVEENSLPLLKQQLPKLHGFRDSWLDVTTHSETRTLFYTDSRSMSLGVAEAGTLNLDLRALKSQNPILFLEYLLTHHKATITIKPCWPYRHLKVMEDYSGFKVSGKIYLFACFVQKHKCFRQWKVFCLVYTNIQRVTMTYNLHSWVLFKLSDEYSRAVAISSWVQKRRMSFDDLFTKSRDWVDQPLFFYSVRYNSVQKLTRRIFRYYGRKIPIAAELYIKQ